MNIVLHEPEIPQNTGNIARTCACTGSTLHLIEPLGFSIDEKHVRRAGLDYWSDVEIRTYHDFDDFIRQNPGIRLFLASTKAPRRYTDVQYQPDDFIMFGKETAGIPEEILQSHQEGCIRIPMLEHFRSLNLSNSVAIVLYEALRQLDFVGMQDKGSPRTFSWDR
ncbi:MAG: tRNA (uridine(34)/cytosine(34)/5-carboxymethylaminomethyluridine(34)-2'-O)-methyltransferase TrmL [Clostridiales bacterium]|nr:tRNA (uridine(34)/cytosine(34)/5-carboxymethylaminomethyluridine(34)-2'-O)-methyltransferase TrmL [Clostridiales bacterium]